MCAKRRTTKQQKFLRMFSENLGKEKPLSMKELLLRAGYSETSAHQQTNVLLGLEEDIHEFDATFNKKLRCVIQNAFTQMTTEKLEGATASELSLIIARLYKVSTFVGSEAEELTSITCTWADIETMSEEELMEHLLKRAEKE